MAEKARRNKNSSSSVKRDSTEERKVGGLKDIIRSHPELSNFLQQKGRYLQTVYRRKKPKVIRVCKKTFNFCRRTLNKLRKPLKNIVEHWKFLTVFLPTFFLGYYLIGSMISENIDVKSEYKSATASAKNFETPTVMTFLLKRELDDKMWTPNVPFIFPAYVLDNMPNFQIGIVNAVKDTASSLRRIKQSTPKQKENIKAAYKYLNYSPQIWIMSRKGNFNLAPSSNTQYRKAAAELQRFAQNGDFYPQTTDLKTILQKLNKSLQKITMRSEAYQRENSAAWLDTGADDIFYYNRGYAFAMWQISKTLGADYKENILADNLYTEWTYLVNSLKKAAEFAPTVVLNGAPDSLWKPNHLMMQGYYLQRAIIAAENVYEGLDKNANQD